MAFTEAEIKKFQALADEMAQLIEDADGTSNEASVAYGKIGRVCANVLSRYAAAEAKRTARAGHVTKFQTARQSRAAKVRGKKTGTGAGAAGPTTSAGAAGPRTARSA
jgi:hypothetical protein